MTYHSPKYYAALRAERRKHQASSAKLQASSSKRVEKITNSIKPQAERFKIPAGSFKRQDP